MTISKRFCLPCCINSEDEFESENDDNLEPNDIGFPPYASKDRLCQQIPIEKLSKLRYVIPGADRNEEKVLSFRWIQFVIYIIIIQCNVNFV